MNTWTTPNECVNLINVEAKMEPRNLTQSCV